MAKLIISMFFMVAIFVALIWIGKEGQKVKEYKKEKEIVTVETLSKVVCNRCGKQIDFNGQDCFDQIEHFEVHYGYGSLKDGDVYEFDLCEKCLDLIYENFKHKPEVNLHLKELFDNE